MTHEELLKALTNKTGLSKKNAGLLIKATFECITEGALESGEVFINHFGIFRVRELGERMSRNPKTGQPLKVKKSRTLKFIHHRSEAKKFKPKQ
jgi:DNA-binding protein HU-beta